MIDVKGVLRWYGLEKTQLKNEYIDKCIIIKILDSNTSFDNWDIKIKKSYLIMSKETTYFIDNNQEIYNISLDKIKVYKNGRRVRFKYFSSIIKKYFSTPISLAEIIKILDKSSPNLKEKFEVSGAEFYIAYFIQCEPL